MTVGVLFLFLLLLLIAAVVSGGRFITARRVSWIIVAFLGIVPLTWLMDWATEDKPKASAITNLLPEILIFWAISAALAYFLIVSARGIKIRIAKDELEMQRLHDQPLTEMRPSLALIRPGEKAYGAIKAELLKEQTIGYTAGTSGMSVHVTKGVTLRTSGTRGKTVKGMVAVASGELAITDKRIIFSGDRKSFSISLDDLLNSTNYADGFGFSDNRTTYTPVTESGKEREIFAIALQKVLRG